MPHNSTRKRRQRLRSEALRRSKGDSYSRNLRRTPGHQFADTTTGGTVAPPAGTRFRKERIKSSERERWLKHKRRRRRTPGPVYS